MKIKCYLCGRFIGFKDFDEGRTGYTMAEYGVRTIDSPKGEPLEPEPICPRCKDEGLGDD